MRQCQYCHYPLSPLARFCGQCGKKTGFDLPALQVTADRPLAEKINPSRKRKGLAIFVFALFIWLIVSSVVFFVISFLLGENFAGALFIVALVTLLFYTQAKFIHFRRLLKRETKNRCQKCGYRYAQAERYCEQCGRPLG
jgi:predicted amidophosphoribosyltransferase